MHTFRTKLEQRIKQIKKKLSGYVYVSYRKSECPPPKTQPTFPQGTATVLVDLYSEYQSIDMETTMGRIRIPTFNHRALDSYDVRQLLPNYDESYLEGLVTLSEHPRVVYHQNEEKIYLIHKLNLLPLNLNLQTYYDWQIFFLGIYGFEYFFTEQPEQFAEELKKINQSLNFSFYEGDMIPDWFEHDIPEIIQIFPTVDVGTRVKEYQYEFSGVITEIKKTKAIVAFDAGFTAEKLVRELVHVIDNDYEKLLKNTKSIISLSPIEFKRLTESCYSRYEFRSCGSYQHLNNLRILNAFYTNLPIQDVFREGIRVLKELNTIYADVRDYNEAQEWNFTRQVILGGMFVTCFWHLQSNETVSLSEALQAPLNAELANFVDSEEKRDEDIAKETPIGYFKDALSSWSKSDFDYLELDKAPLGFGA